LGLGKSLTGLGLKKFKKPWAWACPKLFSTPEFSFGFQLETSVFYVFRINSAISNLLSEKPETGYRYIIYLQNGDRWTE
jgi:hypothetical protein